MWRTRQGVRRLQSQRTPTLCLYPPDYLLPIVKGFYSVHLNFIARAKRRKENCIRALISEYISNVYKLFNKTLSGLDINLNKNICKI